MSVIMRRRIMLATAVLVGANHAITAESLASIRNYRHDLRLACIPKYIVVTGHRRLP